MKKRRLALDPLAVDDVVALAPVRDELRDQLGRVLEIAVEQHDGVTGRDPHPGGERALRAERAGVVDRRRRSGSRCRELGQHLAGVVGRAVVDEDDLVVRAHLGERADEPLVHDRHGGGVPIAGDDGGELHSDHQLALRDLAAPPAPGRRAAPG